MAEYEQDDALETDAPEQPEANEGRIALVKEWCERIRLAKEHRKETFKAMRQSQDFAMYGADKKWREAGNYTVPILPRYINQSVSTLYARNPKTIFKRRHRLNYRLWDGREDTLMAAMEGAAMGDANSMAIIEEVLAVRQQNLQLDRMGETLQILYQYYIDEQASNFKQQLKAAVRRAKVCKVAWIKLGFQRILEPRPEKVAEIADVSSKIANIEAALAKMAEGSAEYDENSAQLEELRLNLADLERDQFLIAREGLVFDFPKADQIIVDPKCTHLKSLSGARFVAHEFELTPQEILKIYKVDIGTKYTAYDQDGRTKKVEPGKSCARVYEVWDKENLQTFVVCEGYKDFLKEPATPEVYIERFWPFFPIVFNEVEHYDEIYPLSDVEQAKDIQEEYNRSREALREHRIAARPYWVEGVGMDKDEKAKLAHRAAHEVVSVPTLGVGQKIDELLQRGPTAPIDPNLYETEIHFNDLLRVVGYQEAQIGAVSGATATETSIAQQSQSASQTDNVDDIDEVLTELARASGQILLQHVDKQTVIEIVGEGAVWPDLPETRESVAREIYLEAEAGSTGRPNQAAELANTERAAPWLVQLPNINPKPIIRKYADLLNIPMDEMYADGLPSITALNALMAKSGTNPGANPTGDPQTDPNAQGVQGAQNAPNSQINEPGAQPAYASVTNPVA